jgi:hypothetical protein
MFERSLGRLILPVSMAAFALLFAACGPNPGGTFTNGSEAIPAPGYFHVEGDPKVAGQTLVLRYAGSDGVPSQISDTIERGQPVVIDRTDLSGPHTLLVNGTACRGSFEVRTDMETDLVVHLTSEGCDTSVLRTHIPGGFTH